MLMIWNSSIFGLELNAALATKTHRDIRFNWSDSAISPIVKRGSCSSRTQTAIQGCACLQRNNSHLLWKPMTPPTNLLTAGGEKLWNYVLLEDYV
jgi:hypothetical protein